MRFTLASVAFIGIASLLTHGAGAAVVLDQSFLGSPTLSQSIGQGTGPAFPIITQTFAVGVSGTLRNVDASIYPLNTPSTVTASIYDVVMGGLGPTPHGSISLSASALTTPSNNRPLQAPDLSVFDFTPDAIAITAGQELALVVSATQASNTGAGAGYYAGPGYSGGTLTRNPDGGTGLSLFLQTFVETPAAVPEPGSLALLGGGLLGLGLVRHRRKAA